MKDTNPKDVIGDKKVPLWLCSPIAMAHWAFAQFAGMIKYGAWNWRAAGIRTSVYISALKRHIEAYESGEEYDPVDGTHHLGSIMAGAAILLEARHMGKLVDDRPPATADLRMVYLEVEAGMAALRGKHEGKAPRHWTIADTEEIKNAPISTALGKQNRRDRSKRAKPALDLAELADRIQNRRRPAGG
jgi:hypothetical protein